MVSHPYANLQSLLMKPAKIVPMSTSTAAALYIPLGAALHEANAMTVRSVAKDVGPK